MAVRDTIGAGDTFMAAVIAGLRRNDLLDPARLTARTVGWLGELAVAAAAITCSRNGADPPWRHELQIVDAPPG